MSAANLPPNFEHLEPLLGAKPSLLLIRHAARGAVKEGMDLRESLSVLLSPEGEAAAESLGRHLAVAHPKLRLAHFLSSGVPRNNETLARFIQGGGYANGSLDELKEKMDKDPVLVARGLIDHSVGEAMMKNHALIPQIYTGEHKVSDDHSVDEAGEKLARFLAELLDAKAVERSDFVVAVSHDIPMGLLVNRYFSRDIVPGVEPGAGRNWPQFLEAMLLQREEDGSHRLHFRGHAATI